MKEMIIQIIAAPPKVLYAAYMATGVDEDGNTHHFNTTKTIDCIGLTNLGRVIGLVAMENGEFCSCDELCDFVGMDYCSPSIHTASIERRINKKGEL